MDRPMSPSRARHGSFLATVALGSAVALSALRAASGFQARTLNFGSRFEQTTLRQRAPSPARRTSMMRSSADASAASAAAAASAGGTVPIDSNAFRLVQYRENVELQTAVYKVVVPSASSGDDAAREITLVSMVHLADQGYYTEIMRDASSYDRVLFELIAGPDVSEQDADGNRAVTDYVYPTREQVSDSTAPNDVPMYEVYTKYTAAGYNLHHVSSGLAVFSRPRNLPISGCPVV